MSFLHKSLQLDIDFYAFTAKVSTKLSYVQLHECLYSIPQASLAYCYTCKNININCLFLQSFVVLMFYPIFVLTHVSMGNTLSSISGMAALALTLYMYFWFTGFEGCFFAYVLNFIELQRSLWVKHYSKL